MNDTETILDAENGDTKPRKPRKRNDGTYVYYYQIINGKPKEVGRFPETAIGTLSERNITMFAKDIFREGDIRAEIRKPNGHYERSFEFSIAETEKPSINGNESDLENGFDEPENFDFEAQTGQMNKIEVENLLLKERMKRMEEDYSRHKMVNQSETQTLINALEDSRREQRELFMMLIQQAQQPQQNPQPSILDLIKGTIEVQRGVRDLAEEISPQQEKSGGGFLDGAASVINAVGNSVPKLEPVLKGLLSGGLPKIPVQPAHPQAAQPAANGNGSGEFSDLASKISKKKEKEVEKK